jgi:WD40 repeat protein
LLAVIGLVVIGVAGAGALAWSLWRNSTRFPARGTAGESVSSTLRSTASEPLREVESPPGQLGRYPTRSQANGRAFAPDSRTLAVAGTDRIEFLNSSDGSLRQGLAPDANPKMPRLVRWSPNGDWLALGYDQSVTLQPMTMRGRPEVRLLRLKVDVLDLDFAPDGRTLAVASADAVRLWELANDKRSVLLAEGINVVQTSFSAVRFTRDGNLFVNASRGSDGDKLQRADAVWKLRPIQLVHTPGNWCSLESGDEAVVTPAGRHYAVFGPTRRSVRLWDLETGRELSALIPRSAVTAATFAPDDQTLALGHADGTVSFWDFQTGKRLGDFQANPNGASFTAVRGIHFAPNGKIVVTGSESEVKFWDVAKVLGKELQVPQLPAVKP